MMITALIVRAVCALVSFIGGLIPSLPAMPGMTTIADFMGQAATSIVGLHNWIAIYAIRDAIVWMLALTGVIIGIRLIRITASFMTGGGGGAA